MPAERIRRGKKGASRGFSFIELLVALSITALGFSAFLGIALQTMQDYEFFTKASIIAQWNQQIVNDIRDDTVSTKKYLNNDARGLAYLAALALPMTVPPLNTMTLPTIDETGLIEVDTAGNAKTGNALFFAKTLKPFVTTVQMDPATTATFRINMYSLILYYLSIRPNDMIGQSPSSLDLIRWVSVPVADYGQVMAIQDPDPADFIDPRKNLVANFVTQTGSTYLWDSTEDVDHSFYLCDATGFISGMPEMNMVIPQSPSGGLDSTTPGGPRTGKRTSICMNTGPPGFEGGPRVPLFAIPDATGDGFPHGFEVQLVGPSSARKLLIRLAMVKEGSQRMIGKDFKAILTTRDF